MINLIAISSFVYSQSFYRHSYYLTNTVLIAFDYASCFLYRFFTKACFNDSSITFVFTVVKSIFATAL